MEDLIPDDSLIDDALDVEDSVLSTAIQEDSFSSTVGFQPLTVSTPRRPSSCPRRKASSSGPSQRLKCTKCDKDYANERTLSVHMKMHAMKGLFSRIPKFEELRQMTKASLLEIVEVIIQECGTKEPAMRICCQNFLQNFEDVQELVNIFSECFKEIFQNQNALLPSHLRHAMFIKFNRLTSQEEFRNKIVAVALKGCKSECGVVRIFLGKIVLKLMDKVLAKVLRHMRGNPPEENPFQLRSKDDFQSDNFQGLVYYIGGYVLYKCLRKAKKNPESATWQLYSDLLKSKFLRTADVGVSQCSSNFTAFTESIDRGGLKHCNQEAFDFFFNLIVLIMSLEGADGSLPVSRVEDHFFKNYVLVLMWDDLAGSSLQEDHSLQLLIMFIESCTKVVHKGIMKRRLNDNLEKAYVSVGLRARLSR